MSRTVSRGHPGRRRPAAGARTASSGLRRLVRRGLALLLAVVVAGPLVVAFRVWFVAQLDDRPASDAIVVMGAAQYDGRPSEVFAARLRHAARLYESGVAPRMITVGSALEGDAFTEAEAAKRWLGEHAGVPARRVIAVPRGHDTLQSLRAAHDAMRRHGWTSAVIVTDPWHSLRSRTIARDLGMRAATSPARTGNPLVGPPRIEARYITRETLAFLYYALFHRSTDLEFFPI